MVSRASSVRPTMPLFEGGADEDVLGYRPGVGLELVIAAGFHHPPKTPPMKNAPATRTAAMTKPPARLENGLSVDTRLRSLLFLDPPGGRRSPDPP